MACKYFSIKNCEFTFKCPRDWSSLATTANDGERHCESCEKPVYLCIDDATLATHVQAGHCVAVEDRMSAGNLNIGQIASEYSAPTPEPPRGDDKQYSGLKIAPSSFGQKVDAYIHGSVNLNWD